MTHSTNLSTEVSNAVAKFREHVYANPTSFSRYVSDNPERCLLFSIYALRDDANQKVLEVIKDGIVDLHSCLEKEEINLLSDNLLTLVHDFERTYRDDSLKISKELLTLCSSLVSISSGQSVYLPYAGAGDFLEIVSQGAECIGFEKVPHSWAISKIRQQLLGLAGDIYFGESLEVQGKFDCIFTCPPLGNPLEVRGVVDFLSTLATCHLADKGKMVCFLPSHFCVSKGGWKRLRKTIANSDLSATVLTLPKGVLRSMPGFSLLVLENNHQGNIVLVNASGEKFQVCEGEKGFERYSNKRLNVDAVLSTTNSKDASLVWSESAESLNDDFSFAPSHYLPIYPDHELEEGESLVSLDNIVEIIRPKLMTKAMEVRVLKPAQLSDHYLNCDINVESISTQKKTGARFVTEDCIVVGFYNEVMKVARVHGVSESNPLLLNLRMVAFKMRDTESTAFDKEDNNGTTPRKVSAIISEDYLLRCLTSPWMLQQAKDLEYFMFLPVWFLDLRVFVPSLSAQNQRCKADAASSLKDADLRLQQLYEDFRKDMHMKKHAIGQTLFNLRNWWDNLNLARQKGNGVVSDSDTIGVTHKITVAEIYRNLDITMSKLSTQLSKFDSGYGLAREEFTLPAFLEQYIAEHRSPIFTFEYDANAYQQIAVDEENEEVNSSDGDQPLSITFSKEALAMVLNNIVNNACTHGFEGRDTEHNKIRLAIHAHGTDCILTVSNNGAPLKDDFQKEDVFVYGQTSGEAQEHFGIGGYEIKRLMNEFEGDVELVANSESEYSVTYKLIFHNTHLTND